MVSRRTLSVPLLTRCLALLGSIAGAIVLASLALPAVADSTPEFAGMPWGSSDGSVRTSLSSKGFSFEKRDADGDLDFKGEIDGQPVVAFAFMTPNRQLVKVQAVFLTSDGEAISFFNEMQQTLANKYGEPPKHFNFYEDPYSESDSESEHELAFRVGKGHLSSFWTFDDGGAIWMQVTKKLTVSISYESKYWPAELARRKNAENSVF
jgi:hypothetical protein